MEQPKLWNQGGRRVLKTYNSFVAGDIVTFSVGCHKHWAVYIGQQLVIHLVGWDVSRSVKTTECFRPGVGQAGKIVVENIWDAAGTGAVKANENDGIWSPLAQYDIVERAKGELGMISSGFLPQDCQKFAWWCRYNKGIRNKAKKGSHISVRSSSQVEKDNQENMEKEIKKTISCMNSGPLSALEKGDLVKFDRVMNDGISYSHWAVYIGNGRIIHLTTVGLGGESLHISAGSGLSSLGGKAKVVEEELSQVTGVKGTPTKVNILDDEKGPFPRNEIVSRARGKIGEVWYKFQTNSSQQFALWCRYDEKLNDQLMRKEEFYRLETKQTPASSVESLRIYPARSPVQDWSWSTKNTQTHVDFHDHNRKTLDQLHMGDLVTFQRAYHKHWAVYIGTNQVIHLVGWDSINKVTKESGCVGSSGQLGKVYKDNFWTVAANHKACKANEKDGKWRALEPTKIWELAQQKLDEICSYDCEKFANWCRYGRGEKHEYNSQILCGLRTGDLVKFHRLVYTHWAVYVGDERVIHLVGLDNEGVAQLSSFGPGFGRKIAGVGEVAEDSFWVVAKDSKASIANMETEGQNASPLPASEIVYRARSRLGTIDYNIFTNNCEHFAKWCRYGQGQSNQSVVLSKVLGGAALMAWAFPGTAAALAVGTVAGYFLSSDKGDSNKKK